MCSFFCHLATVLRSNSFANFVKFKKDTARVANMKELKNSGNGSSSKNGKNSQHHFRNVIIEGVELFQRAGILNETIFDEIYNKRQIVALSANSIPLDLVTTSAKVQKFNCEVTYPLQFSIDNPLDAVILLRSCERSVLLQALDILIACCEDRLQFSSKNVVYGPDEGGNGYVKAALLHVSMAVARIIQLLSSDCSSIQLRAAILFASLSQSSVCVAELERISWIAEVEKLFTVRTRSLLLDPLTYALRNLAVIHSVQHSVLELGLLENLLQIVLLDAQDPDVIENVLEALERLSANEDIQKWLILQGGFEAACQQAVSEIPTIQCIALKLMHRLLTAPVEKAIDRFREAGGMSTILSIFSSKEFQFLHAQTLEILCNLLGIPSITHELGKQRIYDCLLDMALSIDYAEADNVQIFALRCISNAASYPEECLLMSSSGVAKKLMRILEASSPQVQSVVLQVIGKLAVNDVCRKNFQDQSVPARLILLLKSKHACVREWAFFAVNNFVLRDQQFQNEFHKEKLADIIDASFSDIISVQNAGLLGNIISCITNICDREDTKRALEGLVFRSLSTWLTHPDETVRIPAVACAVIFTKSDLGKTEFTKMNGYALLTAMMDNPCSEEVFRKVTFAISVLAITKDAVFKLASAGCIQRLLTAQRCMNPVNQQSAVTALRRLADWNTSFKFALLDTLSSDDRIEHGFYDMRAGIKESGFWSFEEFLQNKHSPEMSPVVYICVRDFAVPARGGAADTENGQLGIDNGATSSRLEESPDSSTVSIKLSKDHSKIPADQNLVKMVSEATDALKGSRSIREEMSILAKLVASHMSCMDPESYAGPVRTLSDNMLDNSIW
ncbi:uncharacterized protein LOC129590186 isoform X2 [Paramacrobiotus metropolitanus]|uniref:uncharacterized protein LOC129590186 isoform X2 n=1 Tax=Paramacrobiotus metropolitanus TaxID=2943436 RepID=UPI0024461893|nr:uncharacterized protein LOC129590186 isoform X2 [Paramacrobiotus metropolitanus]